MSGAIGMLLLGSVGFAVGHDFARDSTLQCLDCPLAKNQRRDVKTMTLAGAGLGLVIGAAIGHERWARVSLEPLRYALRQ
jgi:hypothetical protein